jgi:hypothetical protein
MHSYEPKNDKEKTQITCLNSGSSAYIFIKFYAKLVL